VAQRIARRRVCRPEGRRVQRTAALVVPALLVVFHLLALPGIASARSLGWAGTITGTYIGSGTARQGPYEWTATMTGTSDGLHPTLLPRKTASQSAYSSANPGNVVWHYERRDGCQRYTEDFSVVAQKAVYVSVNLEHNYLRIATAIRSVPLHWTNTDCAGVVWEDQVERSYPDVGIPLGNPHAMQCAQGKVGPWGDQRLPANWKGTRLKGGYDCTGSPIPGSGETVREIVSWDLHRVGNATPALA
jgi:hypothetical protein